MVVLITGGSSGIGLALCEKFAKEGHNVFELSRKDVTHNANITHITGSVTDIESIRKALEITGSVDMLINNAGFGISGACEFINNGTELFQTNFHGMDNACKAVIPLMRKNGGKIINISSVAAVAPIPFQAHYSASKAAINAYSQALAIELKPFNIQVSAIMPGDIKTGFTKARIKENQGNKEYLGRIEKSVLKMEKDEQEGMSPQKAADIIYRIALKKKLKPLYSVGLTYSFLSVLASILPSSVRLWIINLLYGGK